MPYNEAKKAPSAILMSTCRNALTSLAKEINKYYSLLEGNNGSKDAELNQVYRTITKKIIIFDKTQYDLMRINSAARRSIFKDNEDFATYIQFRRHYNGEEKKSYNALDNTSSSPAAAGVTAVQARHDEPLSFELVEQEVEKILQLFKEIPWIPVHFSKAQQVVIALHIMNQRALPCVDQNFQEYLFINLANPSEKDLIPDEKKELFLPSDTVSIAFQLSQMIKTMRLDVEASIEKIIDAYCNYDRIILLRPLKSDVLILGCGQGTCSQDRGRPLNEPYHAHQDTIDRKIDRNPSVICSWGNMSQMKYFKDQYLTIYEEGLGCQLIDSEKYWDACAYALKENGMVISYNSTISRTRNLFQILSRSAPRYTSIIPPREKLVGVAYSYYISGRPLNSCTAFQLSKKS